MRIILDPTSKLRDIGFFEGAQEHLFCRTVAKFYLGWPFIFIDYRQENNIRREPFLLLEQDDVAGLKLVSWHCTKTSLFEVETKDLTIVEVYLIG
jgi:hypothetical protein